MIMPVTPRMEPTDRSMWRITMTSTMPVDMTAMEELWTDRFQRLRGVRNVPSARKSNAIQMTARAPIIPRKRMSISSAPRNEVGALAGAPAGAPLGCGDGTGAAVVVSVMSVLLGPALSCARCP